MSFIPESWLSQIEQEGGNHPPPSSFREFDIFIDGSTTDQAKTYHKKHLRRGGIGIYHPASQTRIARPFPLPNPTNNRCEYYACIFALEWILRITSNLSLQERAKIKVTFYSDSQLLINSLTKWLPGWKRRGWKKADGQPVKNQELLEVLDQYISNQLPLTKFIKVKAHRQRPSSGQHAIWSWEGNHIADQLANDGRKMAESINPV